MQGTAVVVGRKAADPGLVARISDFLSDNALTRHWAETMDRHVISPIEQWGLSDDELKNLVATKLAYKNQNREGGVDKMVGSLESFLGRPLNEEYVAELRTMENPVSDLKDQLYSYMEDAPRDRVAALWQPEIDGRMGLTQGWDHMRQLGLGSPVAAYSAVTAGGAMGTAAAMEAYNWLMAQQQAEKESQLPVEPEVIV